jgi:hypothetical protein
LPKHFGDFSHSTGEVGKRRSSADCTPVYLRDPLEPSIRTRSQGPKLIRDRLLEIMSDFRWHAARELEEAFPQGEWVRAMRELLPFRWAFERSSHSLRLYRREPGERAQVLVELLAGIDATKPDVVAEVPEERKRFRESSIGRLSERERGVSFDPTKDELLEEPEGPTLVLSEDPSELALPAAESVTMTAAILAKKGSGKTYLGGVLAEEFLACPGLQVPVIIIDPAGPWYGLLADAFGKPSSFSMLVLGGAHGDLSVTHRQGVQAAEAVHEIWPRSALLDLSYMVPAEQHEFVADFGQRLYVLNVRSPLHVIVDEADEFAPQVLDSSSRHQRRSLGVIDRMVRRGRTKGFGTTLITQRTAVISKNVLSQTDSLFLLNMVAPSDLEAVSEWMKYRIPAEHRMAALEQLPNLQPGTAYFMQSGQAFKFRRFVVRKKRTFDSSRTPRANEVYVEPTLSRAPEGDVAVARKWLEAVPTAREEEPNGAG